MGVVNRISRTVMQSIAVVKGRQVNRNQRYSGHAFGYRAYWNQKRGFWLKRANGPPREICTIPGGHQGLRRMTWSEMECYNRRGDGGHNVEAPVLRIGLLGTLDLRYRGAPLPPLESARTVSLLAYLLLHRQRAQPRQHLAFLLWPDSTEPQARTNLRHLLYNLRRALPDPDRFLEVTLQAVRWREEAPFWLDVAAFEEGISRAEKEGGDTGLAMLREAVELYTGDLAEGCYDEWLLGERERLRQRYLEALARLTKLLEARGDYAQAISYAERLLRHDPLHEETYRLLMRLHDARGDRARALRVYHACVTTLERELGAEPSEATREAYEALLPVRRETGATRRPTGRMGGLPLVGQADEWRRLTGLWRLAERGSAQFVLVTGEPGIGKTKLTEELRTWCVHRGAVAAEAHSYPAEGMLPYGPLVEWLRSDPLKVRLRRLGLARYSELAPLLPELFSEAPDKALSGPLPESDQRQRLFDAMARAILSVEGPLLLVAEDLHWWGRESLQFLHYLVRVGREAGLLVVATARREEVDSRHPLNDLRTGLLVLGNFTEIDLGRLSREETTVLAQHIASRSMEETEAGQLYAETEGNPLFVVEALRAGWKGGGDGRRWTSPKVQAVIESRLKQLSEPARELVGLAATVGRQFTSEVLAQAGEADEGTLVRGLDELWQRGLIREQGAVAYDFSHDKIREVAYLSLSPTRRRQHHLRVAQALERLYAHDFGPVSGQIAGHYEYAGALGQAITWYQRAAEAAQQVYANAEAVRLLDRALDCVRGLPATSGRDARELEILTALPGALGAVEGYGSKRITAVQQRALGLVRKLGVEAAPPLLRSLAVGSLSQGDFESAHRVGGQLQALGQRNADSVLLVEAAYVLGIAAFWSGQFEAARRQFEAAVGRYRPEHRRAHLLWYGQDPKVVCLSRLGNTLWFLGCPEEAVRARDAALALANDIGHPHSRSTALVFASMLALDMREGDHLRQYVSALKEGRSRHEAKQIQISREVLDGYVDVLDGKAEGGIARIQRALGETHGVEPAPGNQAVVMRVLLEACLVAGDTRTGLAAAEGTLAMGGARLWDAEALRLRAEFSAALGAPVQEVEADLGRALHVARSQGAPSLEVRAATSLLRYRLKQGDGDGVKAARDLVLKALGAFPEGTDTQDLREAAAILNDSRK